MADRPIIFSAPMVRALLAGTKTQTRRVLKPQPAAVNRVGVKWPDGVLDCDGRRLPYAPGDRLWVREAWRTLASQDPYAPSEMWGGWVFYEADETDAPMGELPWNAGGEYGRYRHARFMPRWASRLTLPVTEVRVQRLQEITHEDARAEGCLRMDEDGEFGTTRGKFALLWTSLHGADAWDANPWVCAISFTVERANIDQARAA